MVHSVLYHLIGFFLKSIDSNNSVQSTVSNYSSYQHDKSYQHHNIGQCTRQIHLYSSCIYQYGSENYSNNPVNRTFIFSIYLPHIHVTMITSISYMRRVPQLHPVALKMGMGQNNPIQSSVLSTCIYELLPCVIIFTQNKSFWPQYNKTIPSIPYLLRSRPGYLPQPALTPPYFHRWCMCIFLPFY